MFRPDRSGFEEIKRAFPEMSDFTAQCLAYPLTGDPHGDELTDYERRWVESHRYIGAMGAAARVVLMQTVSLQGLQRWYDNDIAIPFGGMNARLSERQRFFSQIATADGELGKTYFSGFDNTIGFDQHSQHFSIQAFMSHKVMLSDVSKFYIAEYTRGGPKIGGKGCYYVNEGIYLLDGSDESENIRDHITDGQRLGDYSNLPILQSYNVAIEGQGFRHADIRGNWHNEDFVGRLHNSAEFMKQRPRPMYSGQFFINHLFGDQLKNSVPAIPLDKLSFANTTALRRNNRHIHQTTVWHYHPVKGEQEKRSHHPWGDQYPGLALKEQSLEPIRLKDHF
jgi:hypothetical protein